MKNKLFWPAAIALSGALIPLCAEAHLRNYLETYGYSTLETGRFELELWSDRRNPDSGSSYWFHQTEVEYGVTDRYTVGLYGVFRDGQGFAALKIENRYRLSRPGQWPLDTALYLEFKDANGSKDDDEIEGKVIMSKDIGAVNYTANAILGFEREVKSGGGEEWEALPSLALAAAYGRGSRVTPGIELVLNEEKSRVIPGLYIDLAPEVRLNLGLSLGLQAKADDWQLKSILEIEF
ncbi:MAG: hypothetical protein HY547_09040 [Elusimicrobia bacterium]|nr:hypothetical protein [Elusimicrobiota bacterium]